MHEEEKAKFPEILPVIEEYLKKQQANGEPMRIHFWDTNHFTDEPHQVFADKSLHDLVKKYGAPLYVVEAADAKFSDRIFPQSMDDLKENLPLISI